MERLGEFLQKRVILAFQPCQKNRVRQVVPVGDVRGDFFCLPCFFLFSGHMVVHQEIPFLIYPHPKAKLV